MATLPTFEKFSSGLVVATTFADRIRGKNVIITGGSPEGLGDATARAIAPQKPAILGITYRSESTVKDFLPELRAMSPETKVIGILLDLGDLDSIRAAGEAVNKLFDHIDVLINNAGIMSIQTRELTNYGIEKHLGVNHIGHFLFTNLLLPKMLAASEKSPSGDTRILNLTGGWHHFGGVRFDDLNFDGKPIPKDQEPNRELLKKFGNQSEGIYFPEAAYSQSKTANILFSTYLTEHLQQKGVVSFAVNPGGIYTNIGRHLSKERANQIVSSGILDKTPDQGVSSTIAAAFDPRITAKGSVYIDGCQQQSRAAKFATDPAIAERLWKLSEEIVKQEFVI